MIDPSNKKSFSAQKTSFLNLFLIILCIICVNIIGYYYFFRLDLTEDQKYTLTKPSKVVLQQLPDVVYIEVYLDGDLPGGFKRFRNSIKETLDEFRIYAGANIQYRFIDPTIETDEKTRNELFMTLAQKGLQPTNLFSKDNQQSTEKLVFPGCLIKYRGVEKGINLLKGNAGVGPQQVLNQSIEGLEYELISNIKKITQPENNVIGIVQGHGELGEKELEDLLSELSQSYSIKKIDLRDQANIQKCQTLMIAKPFQKFNENEKLILDQYIINGGNLVLLIDRCPSNLQDFAQKNSVAFPIDLNLDDLLFKYGARINQNLVKDLQCAPIPVVTGMMGDKPQTQLVPWVYYIQASNLGKHPLSKGLNEVWLRFASSIDTVTATGITKTPLILSSQYCNTVQIPASVSIDEIKQQPDPKVFNKSNLILGVLLEGKFNSAFKNRLSPEQIKNNHFKESDQQGKIILIADGDFVRNDIMPDSSQILPLGFDRFTQRKFANKDFIINCFNYLTDPNTILVTRSKEITLRPLDKVKIKEKRNFWQIINVVVPILILILGGIIQFVSRKKKFNK